MGIHLTDAARRYLSAFADVTGARATDCIVNDEIVFVVEPDDMGRAIGTHGRTVKGLEERLGKEVVLVEDAEFPEVFVANALAPAAVYDVELETQDGESVAIASVDPDDVGVAIGRDGERIARAKHLAGRHFDIADIEVRPTERRA